MFKFLFRRNSETPIVETQRQVFERALGELNGVIAQLDVKPALTFDPETGALSFAMPERFSDETLALPAPEPKTESEASDAESASANEAPDETDKPSEEKA